MLLLLVAGLVAGLQLQRVAGSASRAYHNDCVSPTAQVFLHEGNPYLLTSIQRVCSTADKIETSTALSNTNPHLGTSPAPAACGADPSHVQQRNPITADWMVLVYL